jgi:hypothetical protein
VNAPARVHVGDMAPITYTVSNNGPSVAASPVVTITVPANTLAQSITKPAGWNCTLNPSPQQYTCSAASLAAGNTAVFKLTTLVQVVALHTVLTSTITVSSSSLDAVLSNNQAMANLAVVSDVYLPLMRK